jgi:endonuclease-3
MKYLLDYLDELYPNAHCELNYTKDYELLMAIVLSAQTTDKRVNKVTHVLFTKYKTLEELSNAPIEDIENIIREIGTYHKKSIFIKDIATSLLRDYNGIVPNNRKYLETLPGVGRKTTNVFLAEYYNVPAIAVDTHVERVSKRLKVCKQTATVKEVEQTLMKKISKDRWIKAHHQLIFFGRYHCKAIKPNCNNCLLQIKCKYYKDNYKKK